MCGRFSKKNILFVYCVVLYAFLYTHQTATDTTSIRYKGSGSYWMVERSDYARYDNGTYSGLTTRHVRSFMHPISAPKNCASVYASHAWFDGSFIIDEKTAHNTFLVGTSLNDTIPAQFHISTTGVLTPTIDNGFPTFRSFPAYPDTPVSPGDTWVAHAVRSVDPLNKGLYTKIPMTVQYTFKGAHMYKGTAVYRIKAQWATRYGMRWKDYAGDPELVCAQGKHEAVILVRQDTKAAFLITDTLDETFEYANNRTVRLKGSITLFTDFLPAINTEKVLPELEKIATIVTADIDTVTADIDTVNVGLKNNILVEKTQAGLRLSVRDAHFKPNVAEFEDGEAWRLDAIAQTLKNIPDAFFLIEGHTAAIGIQEGELQLSLLRAQRMATELHKRGISLDRFMCKGLGRDYPVATNETAEGRAQNRRVEITILE
ncbi:MAG TPA: OmpA family protein [Treponemataceae bacterium]|nr:OmpA family protein [Treponemataceae bacterium]